MSIATAYSKHQVDLIKDSAAAYRARILAGDGWNRVEAAAFQNEIVWACTAVLDQLAGHEGFENADWDLRELLEADNSRPAESYMLGAWA